jgi:hypothetical protein
MSKDDVKFYSHSKGLSQQQPMHAKIQNGSHNPAVMILKPK